MDKEIEILEYRMEYPTLDLKLYKENIKMYDIKIAVSRVIELFNGFKAKKICPATKEGTKVCYEKIDQNQHDFEMGRIRDSISMHRN